MATKAIAAQDEVARTGDIVTVPQSMQLKNAIALLERQMAYDEEDVRVRITIPGQFYDGALALTKAMQRKFGWVHATDMSFWGNSPPELREVKTGVDTSELIVWGPCVVPGITGRIDPGSKIINGVRVFEMIATVKRKHEQAIRELGELAKDIARDESIFRAKAVRIRFKDNDGDAVDFPEPGYMDVRGARPEGLILPNTVQDAVSTSVFAPIMHTEQCRKYGVPLKRGVLFAGPFGTGKTLSANVTAHLAQRHGWTFIYCERADELAECVRFAATYQPAVVFCEDIDRQVHGERTAEMDDLLNIIDGIESKDQELMVILTTNDAESINKAMLRPGRLDAVINFERPDSETVQRLVRFYGGALVLDTADLHLVGHKLAGQIPAVIRECVERAKLSAIKLYGSADILDGDALLDAAEGMQWQLRLLNGVEASPSLAEQFGQGFRSMVQEAVRTVQ